MAPYARRLQRSATHTGTSTPPPTSIYGPDGTDWPANTPTMSDPITVTVSSIAALNAAVSAHAADPGDVVIALADGTYTDASPQISAVAAAASRSRRILIRPVTMGGVTLTYKLTNACSGSCIAGFISNGFNLQGTSNQAAARMVMASTGNWTVNAVNGFEIVECVAKNRALSSSDRADITAVNTGAGPLPQNGSIRGCWIEGTDSSDPSVQHIDNIQVLAATGSMEWRRTYIGTGGNSSTWIAGFEFQGSYDYADWLFDTCFIAKNQPNGSNGFMQKIPSATTGWNNGSITMTNTVFGNDCQFRMQNTTTWSPNIPISFTNVKGQVLKWIGSDGSGHTNNNLIAGFTVAAVSPPTWVAPPWWTAAMDAV